MAQGPWRGSHGGATLAEVTYESVECRRADRSVADAELLANLSFDVDHEVADGQRAFRVRMGVRAQPGEGVVEVNAVAHYAVGEEQASLLDETSLLAAFCSHRAVVDLVPYLRTMCSLLGAEVLGTRIVLPAIAPGQLTFKPE